MTSMTKSLLAAAGFMLLTSVSGFAAETLTFTMKASMPSLRDACQGQLHGRPRRQAGGYHAVYHLPGRNSGIITGQNESCAVTGNGALINPSNGQKLQRTQYAGGWVVKSDGFTDGGTCR